MKKYAAAKMTKETIKGKYGPFEAYVIRGDTREDTYTIKDHLKTLGFRWFDGTWWISSKKLSDSDKEFLRDKLNVVVDPTQAIPQNVPQAQPAAQVTPAVPPPPAAKQWKTENEEMSKWYGFPINHNIASWEEDIVVDDKQHHIFITMDRLYQPGATSGYYHETKSREHKGLPKYKVTIRFPDIQVADDKAPKEEHKTRDFTISYNKLSEKKWGTYSEEEYIEERKKSIKEMFANPKTKACSQVRFEDDMAKRTPEYKQFLDDIDDKKIQPTYYFRVEDPVYGGDYKLGIYYLGTGARTSTVTLTPLVDAKGAPDSNFGYGNVSIEKTYTVEDFHNAIRKYLQDNKDKVNKEYINYLKSFPFLPEQQQEARGSFNEVKGYITGENRDAEAALKVLQNRGYIRPHKRQRQAPGLTMGDEIRWVIDSKKIVNDAYSTYNYASRMPDYFYTVLAYYIHRKVRGIWSWTDMMLMDVMNIWFRRMKEMGAEFTFEEVEKAIEMLGAAIVSKIYGKATKEQKDKEFFNWFYEGGGEHEQGRQTEPVSLGGLQEFTALAQEFGVDPQDITEDNAKNVYRVLVKNLHPDMYQDPNKKMEMTEKFKKLQEIWDKVPEQYKKASNWYERFIIG